MPKPTHGERADVGRWQRAALLLLLLAAVWRLGYYLEYAAELPFIDGPMYDSVVYLRQAVAIRQGDFGHPTLLAFGPLYGWFLALAGGMAVPLQLMIGVGTLATVWRAARSVVAPPQALAVMALWLSYGLVPFYETKIMSETLGLALLAAAVWAWHSPRFRNARLPVAVIAGVLLALATLARPNVLLALPFFVVAAAMPWSRRAAPAPARMRRTAALVAGAAVVLLANGAWNAANTGRFVPVIMVSRTASIATSNEWDGSLSVFAEDGGSTSAWDVVEQAERRLESPQPDDTGPSIDLAGWLGGAPRKVAETLRDVETTYEYGYYGERTEIRALDVLPASFGVLLILGLAGAVAVWRRDGWRGLVPYLPLILGVIATTTLFHPSSRYRLPIVLPLALLSGHGIALLVEAWRDRMAARVGVVVVVAACALSAYRVTTYELRHPALWELRVARGELERGDLERARDRARRAYETARDADTRRQAAGILDLTGGRLDHSVRSSM